MDRYINNNMNTMNNNNNNNNINIMNKTDLYLQTLDEKELKAFEIARSFLGSSFQLDKSNGFLKWLKNQPSPTPDPSTVVIENTQKPK